MQGKGADGCGADWLRQVGRLPGREKEEKIDQSSLDVNDIKNRWKAGNVQAEDKCVAPLPCVQRHRALSPEPAAAWLRAPRHMMVILANLGSLSRTRRRTKKSASEDALFRCHVAASSRTGGVAEIQNRMLQLAEGKDVKVLPLFPSLPPPPPALLLFAYIHVGARCLSCTLLCLCMHTPLSHTRTRVDVGIGPDSCVLERV